MWDNYTIENLEKFYNEIKDDALYFKEKDINLTNSRGSTILSISSYMGYTKLAKKMISLGCDINKTNSTYLHPLSCTSSIEIAKLFFKQKDLDKNVVLSNMTNFYYIPIYNNNEMIEYMLENLKPEIKNLTKDRQEKFVSTLYMACNINPDVVKIWNAFQIRNNFLIDESKLELDGYKLPVYKIEKTTSERKMKQWSKARNCSLDVFIEYKNLLTTYGLKSIELEKDYNLEKVLQITKNMLSTSSKIFKVSNLGNDNLSLKLVSKINVSYRGLYQDLNKTIYIVPGQYIYDDMSVFQQKSPVQDGILESKINLIEKECVLTFAHEYTHYLQYSASPKEYAVKLYDKDFKKEWEKLKKEVFSIVHTNSDCHDYMSKIVNEYAKSVGIKFSNRTQKQNENYLLKILECSDNKLEYFCNKIENSFIKEVGNLQSQNLSANYTSLKEAVNKNNTNLTKTIKTIRFAFTEQNNGKSFYQSLWKSLDNDRGDVYYNNPIEIHARLIESVLVGEIKEVVNNIPLSDSTKKKLKPKLEKFNKLIISQLELVNSKNNLQKRISYS